MPGIDRNRIVGQTDKQLDEFTCGICHDVFSHPVVTSCCRITYCKQCIDEWLNGHNICPNDRKRLASDDLTDAPRFVFNLIEEMQIKCKFSFRGCPSVHTVGEDADHWKVCPFAECEDCGFKDQEPDHSCVTHLLEANLKLNEDMAKKNTENEGLINLNVELNTELNAKSNELEQLNNIIANDQDQIERLARMFVLPSAINVAKGEPGIVEKNVNVDHRWEDYIIGICKDAIKQFDDKKHTHIDFANLIKAQIDKIHSICKIVWSVSLYARDATVQGDCMCDGNYVRLSFGSLIIVVSAEYQY